MLPGATIAFEDLMSATAITYPHVVVNELTGEAIKDVLEDICDNLFNPDPYYQQGGDMVRCGGIGYRIDVTQSIGQRISDMTLLKSGNPVEATTDYVVAGWGSVNQGVEGPPAWDVLERHVAALKSVRIAPNASIKLVGA